MLIRDVVKIAYPDTALPGVCANCKHDQQMTLYE